MSTLKPITIAGGGLAGLSLGIALRRRAIPVTLWEAGHYPRHRVCGEFICGRGQDVLAQLGLEADLGRAGAVAAHTVAFFSGARRSPVRRLPRPAFCLSRRVLDARLAGEFRQCGGELREHERWRAAGDAEGVVQAAGRPIVAAEQGWRWFGLKVHARNVTLRADLEMHLLPNAYVGASRVEGGRVNLCGLFRRPATTHEPLPPWPEMLRGPPGGSLRALLADAVLEEDTFCSVAGLSLKPRHAAGQDDCRIGDALTMIPPVTGNGMSMALEAASLAAGPLAAYSRGEMNWPSAQRTIARACDAAFAQRLFWARWLQWLLFTPAFHRRPGGLALRSDWLWRLLFSRTR